MGRSAQAFRYCPWCAAPQRAKLVEFFTGTGAETGKALRVSRYTDEGHVRFSVWDESGVAQRLRSRSTTRRRSGSLRLLGVRERLVARADWRRGCDA